MSAPAEICARNSLHWYEAIFRTHRLTGAIVDGLWLSRGDTPPYYSKAMTLVPSPIGPQLAALRDLRSVLHGPWSVKDSFAALDLAPLGFEPLFDAEWVWRDPSPPPKTDPGDVSWQRLTTNVDLDQWEEAWRDNGSPTDRRVFMPELLADPTVALFAAYRGDALVGGCAANISTDAVGFSNVFSADRDADLIVAGALAAVSRFAPGLPIVGYERGDALERAKRLGFRAVGPVRVWLVGRSLTIVFVEHSAIEHEPAQLVAQPLVVEHELSDLVGELGALPPALQATGRLALVLRRRRLRRPDRVCGGTELVSRHVADRRGLARGVRGVPRGPGGPSPRRWHGQQPCGPRHETSPRAQARPRSIARRGRSSPGRARLEVVQHVLRAVGRPDREQAVIVVPEAAAATHGDEPRIPDLWEDHVRIVT